MSLPLFHERSSPRPAKSEAQVQRPRDRGRARLDAQLLIDVLKMLVHRARADAEDRADVAIGLAGGKPADHFPLPLGEPRQRRPLRYPYGGLDGQHVAPPRWHSIYQ